MKKAANNRSAKDEALLSELADELMLQIRKGEPPRLSEYISRYPQLSQQLTDIVSTMIAMDAAQAESKVQSELDGENQKNRILGDFRIIREVGRGGMGTVYEAEQLSLGRRVALKILPFAALYDSRLLQRFKNEAHVAAQLHHNHIVPVHAVGCEKGVHYYAMAYIEGASLAEVIAELKNAEKRYLNDSVDNLPNASRLAYGLTSGIRNSKAFCEGGKNTGTRGKSYFRSAVQLAIEAAEALEHAHQAGIIHRDIKPSNLLLDERGKLWVADFGLAYYCSNREGTLTCSGDFLGTVRYMSPEQVSGEKSVLDHRSDIYSLAITFYELLCLHPVFESADRQEVLRQIVEVEPVKPRRWNAAIPVDLETILLKAMAKEPSQRYNSAREMVADLRRFLSGEPIQARRPGIVEQLWKQAQRYRVAIGAGLIIIIILDAGSAITAWRVARERAAVAAQRDVALGERHRADDNYQLAIKNLESSVLDVLEHRLPRQGKLEVRDQQLLGEALAFYERFLRQNSGMREAREDIGLAYHRVGKIQRGLGQVMIAQNAFQQSMAIFERLAKKGASQKKRDYQIAVLIDYGQLMIEAGKYLEAWKVGQKAVEVSNNLLEGGRVLPEQQILLCQSQAMLGRALRSLSRFEEALKVHEIQLSIARSLLEKLPTNRAVLAVLAEALKDKADIELIRAQWMAAEQYFNLANDSYRKLLNQDPGNSHYRSELAMILLGLGEVLYHQGMLDHAEETIWDGIAEQKALAGEFLSIPEYKIRLAKGQVQMAKVLLEEGGTRDASQFIYLASTLSEQLPEETENWPSKLSMLSALYDIGSKVFVKLGNFSKAQEFQSRHLEIQARAILSVPDSTIYDPKKAIELVKRAQNITPDNGRALTTLAMAYLRDGQWQQAQATAEIALSSNGYAPCQINYILALTHHEQGHAIAASGYYFKAFKQMRNAEEYRMYQEVASKIGIRVKAIPVMQNTIAKTAHEAVPGDGKAIEISDRPKMGEVIQGVKVTTSSHDAISTGLHLSDFSGLADTDMDGRLEHDESAYNMWQSQSGQTKGWVEFDLGRDYRLGWIQFWNFNVMNEQNKGVSSGDLCIWNAAIGWRKISDRIKIPKALDRFDYDEPHEIILTNIIARKVRLENLKNWGDERQIGLSKVRFIASQGSMAQTPHPNNGGVLAEGSNGKLRWSLGDRVIAQRVYLGLDSGSMELIARIFGDRNCELQLPSLMSCRCYYWRIDVETIDGSIEYGPVWRFYTGQLILQWPLSSSKEHSFLQNINKAQPVEFIGFPETKAIDPEHKSGLYFNKSYIHCGNDMAYDLANGFTIATWIKKDKPVNSGGGQTLVTKGETGWRFLLGGANNSISLHGSGIRTTSFSYDRSSALGVDGHTSIKPGEWHHVAGTYDGYRLAVYIDGKLDAFEFVVSGLLTTNTEPLLIGNDRDVRNIKEKYGESSYQGWLDDLQIYNAALSSDEIKTISKGEKIFKSPRSNSAGIDHFTIKED